jgi:Tfp pilus assembly protein PilF
MASLAAMFYIMSMLFYIMFRLSDSSQQRILFLLGSILSFLLALGSKENAAALPAAVLLIEVTCFQNVNWRHRKTAYLAGAIILGASVFCVSIWLFMPQNFSSILKGYEHRPFTLSERLLTEPRILLYYLSQIFYPIPTRLSIEHDVVISTSLIRPWTTLPAFLLCLFLIGLGFSQIRKKPLITLAILFFFLNHIIESTFIPLELIFEHRNYLPSLFLFLPVAAGFKWLYDHYRVENRALIGALAGFLVLLILGLGAGTYVRNFTWATEFSLWQDAMNKAPQSARPLTNLAWQMAYGPNARPNHFDAALKLYERALLLQKPREFSDPIIMNNMSGIYFRKGEHQKAIDLLERALSISPDYTRGRYDFAQILMATGNWNEASKHIDYLLEKHDIQDKYLNAKGLILLHQKRYNEAIEYFKQSLKNFYQFRITSMYLGVALSLNGQFSQAERILNRVLQISRDNMLPLLCLIENSIRAEDIPRAKEYARILFDNFEVTAIKDQLENLSKDHMSPPLSPVLISSIVEIQSEK